MPPEKSVSAHKDTFFECQKMTIAEIFVKKAKKRGSGTKIRGFSTKMRGLGRRNLRLSVFRCFQKSYFLFQSLSE